MKNLLNPKWIFFTNTFPVVLLFLIFWKNYNDIALLLTAANKTNWLYYGIALFVMSFVSTLYALLMILRKKNISVVYGVFVLLTYISYLLIWYFNYGKIIPAGLFNWMISGDFNIYLQTFLMPAIIHSILVVIIKMTSDTKEHYASLNFIMAIYVPIIFYLFMQIVFPLFKSTDYRFQKHLEIVTYVTTFLIFLILILRGIYILVLNRSGIIYKLRFFWKILFVLIFPLIGLAINNGLIEDGIFFFLPYCFGDFGDSNFYFLTLVNGIFLLIPDSNIKKRRIFLFAGRSLTLSFTFYFFLVFLPYLPIGVLLTVAFGLGFLVLTPIILFGFHVRKLNKDYDFLKKYFPKWQLRIGASLAFMIIPALITISYIQDKRALNTALEYIYYPDYDKEYKINVVALQKVFKHIKKSGRKFGFFNKESTPYLSSFYDWLVLDNLTISDSKMNMMAKVFWDNAHVRKVRRRSEGFPKGDIAITKISSQTIFDTSKDAYVSWVNLELKNMEENSFTGYETSFELPEGCWIDNYYLDIGDRREYGILAEKKSAIWVFNRISNRRRDPGILYYQNGNKIKFKVFPFEKQETRKTGIRFLHKEPVDIIFEDNIVHLGDAANSEPENIIAKDITGDVVFISGAGKQNLQLIKREPYYHFVVDISKGNKSHIDSYIERINNFLLEHQIQGSKHKISFTNTFVNTIDMGANWEEKFRGQICKGGFYLDRAIKTILVKSFKHGEERFPVIVVVTDDVGNAIASNNYADYSFAYPDNNIFYELDSNGVVKSHLLLQNSKAIYQDNANIETGKPVRVWKEGSSISYLPDDDKPSIALNKRLINDIPVLNSDWKTGLTMRGKIMSDIIEPEKSSGRHFNTIRNSFKTGIMTRHTSYIVVENDIQKEMLKRKQEKVLSGNKSLDIDNETVSMTEPGILIMALVMMLMIGIAKYWKRVFL